MREMDTPTETLPAPAPDPAARERDVAQNKDIAAFSYLWIMSVFVYFLKKDQSPFIRFHSKQAMILFGLSVVFGFIPYLNRGLEVIILVGCVFGFMAAAQGQWKDVPLVGPFSRGEMTLREVWKEIMELAVRIFHAAKDLSKSAMKKSADTPHKDEPKKPDVHPPEEPKQPAPPTPPLA